MDKEVAVPIDGKEEKNIYTGDEFRWLDGNLISKDKYDEILKEFEYRDREFNTP